MKELVLSITKKDLEEQTFASGGPGGQHQNKTASGVRLIHRESGAVGESRTDRSQHRNRRLALQRLTKHPKFKLWINKMVFGWKSKEEIEAEVDKQMQFENLKVEVQEDGKWIETKHESIKKKGR